MYSSMFIDIPVWQLERVLLSPFGYNFSTFVFIFRRIWHKVNSNKGMPGRQGTGTESDEDDDDESKWNWYIS